jgi:membrane-bound ClpP family serine protease
VILITMGSKMLVSEALKGKFAIFGTAILAIGAGRMLVNAAVINFSQWWSWFWPIILIIAGIALLVRALMGKNDWEVHFD